MTLYCPECGAPLKQQAQFCLECGNDVQWLTRAPAPPPLPVATLSPLSATASAGMSVAAMPLEPPLLQQWFNQLMSRSATRSTTQTQFDGVTLLVRMLYFLFVGWWVSQLWLLGAWLVNLTYIGAPLAKQMITTLPTVTFLVPAQYQLPQRMPPTLAQQPPLVRVLYFFFVGWWLSLVWLELVYVCAISVLAMPIAVRMSRPLPMLTTLDQH